MTFIPVPYCGINSVFIITQKNRINAYKILHFLKLCLTKNYVLILLRMYIYIIKLHPCHYINFQINHYTLTYYGISVKYNFVLYLEHKYNFPRKYVANLIRAD